MGSRGPAPTPTAILEMRGSTLVAGRAGEPRPPVERPTCPQWLSREAKSEWGRQVKELERLGLAAKIDRGLLAAYCEAWAEFHLAAGKLKDGDGYTFTTDKGYSGASPWVQIKNAAVARLVQIAQQLGFSPAARTRLRAPEEKGGGGGVSAFARNRQRGA